MIKSKYKWEKQVEGIISNELIFKTLLKNRNISDFETFFSSGKEKLHNPFMLNDMHKAVERIKGAIIRNEKIMIFGDYDCDGISSIALLYRTLKKLNALVSYDLPDRFNEGYGLNSRAVEDIINKGYKLVITVDNGITCYDEVESLNRAGIDTIITDHHEPNDLIPKAYAIIHAKLSQDYPFKEIAGVMVAYKLASALLDDDLEELFDLAMIGTIADLMPLEDENQAMVNLGIERIKNTSNIGLKKLLDFSNLEIINVTAIAFKIAPKINSSGRLNKAKEAVELLITDDAKRANDLIYDIEKNHDLRKKLTEEAFLICEELVNPEDNVIVVASENLHEGVIGICAQRIVEKYQKSTIVITVDDEGLGKGSARSFGDANILEMLHKNADLIDRYGGHSQAAGLQLNIKNIPKLRTGLNSLDIEEVNPVLKVDMEVYLPTVDIMTIKNIQDKSFFTATYVMRDLRVIRKQLLNNKHTKLVLEIDGYLFDALDFNSLEFYYNLSVGDVISVCGGLNVNSYRKKDSLQIMIKDIECEHLQVLDYRKSYAEVKDYLLENVIIIDDTYLIDNEDIISDLKKAKSIALVPKTRKYNLNHLVDRVELGKIYRLLEKQGCFTESDLKDLLYPFEILRLAVKIFADLGFVEEYDGCQKIKNGSTKIELSNSKTYQDIVEKYHLIEFIYQSDYSKIKTYFKEKMEA